jgi:hypothetical protein
LQVEAIAAMYNPNMDGALDIYGLGVVITHLIAKISSKAESRHGKAPRSKARMPPG